MNTPTDPRLDLTRVIRAPRGPEKTCKSWLTEAAYRMLQNNLEWRWGSAVHERYPVTFRDPATDELDLLMGLLPR